MSLITYVAVALTVIGVVIIVVAYVLADRLDKAAGAPADAVVVIAGVGVVVIVVGLVTFAVWGVANLGYRMSVNECERFAEQAEVDTKMVRYNTTSFDCLVRAESGWVTKGNYWNSEPNGG